MFFSQVEVGEGFGFEMFEPLGPFGRSYNSGIRAALGILWKSRSPGRHEEKQKFSSLRKAREVHSNVHQASARGVEGSLI